MKFRGDKYFRENLGASLIIGFQALLICTSFLVMGNPALANEMATYAYHLLVVGVALQLISFLRNREERGDSG